MNSGQKVQVSDTTMFNWKTKAGNQKFLKLILNAIIMQTGIVYKFKNSFL